jgi:signal transduction histidine kinase
VTYLDARETLSTFLAGSLPDRDLFQTSIGGLLSAAVCGRADTSVRVYGEMVDLLWRDGNPEAAIRLEELWTDLASTHGFSLLCAYPIGNFFKENDARLFEKICASHEAVIPTERVSGKIDDAGMREIARLQQREVALEAEVAHRKELEKALRDALAARRESEESRAFLLSAITLLSSSLHATERLRDLAALIVANIADGCAIDALREDGTAERLAAAGTLREPSLVVPMSVNDRVVGSLTFSGPRCESALTTELARHAAIAFENSRLYRVACDANRTKDEFLATLSHELRTPLTAILGWARMLTLGNLDDSTMQTAFETIERSARAQTTLIDDLLDLSRIVTGKLTVVRELVDLRSAIDNAVATLRLAAEAKAIQVDVTSTAERVVVMGDPTRLQQIVWNLLSNAIKFSPAGGTVSVALERIGAERARVTVRDNGKGIEPGFLPHVFEAFRQADGASTRSHSGLGLGLAIVKYLTEHHGGTVFATSEGAGRGATFTVTLPLALRRSTALTDREADEVVNLTGTRVLLVDDDADTRQLVSAILRHCGAEVSVADSVSCAWDLLRDERPHVLVTDIAMPNEDGYGLLRRIRGELGGSFPVVALTASIAGDEALREAGFDANVRKPIDPFEFARVVAASVGVASE